MKDESINYDTDRISCPFWSGDQRCDKATHGDLWCRPCFVLGLPAIPRRIPSRYAEAAGSDASLTNQSREQT